jgi:anti-sigma-K factor RskA
VQKSNAITEDIDLRCAEYAMGVLEGEPLVRFEAQLASDASLRARVSEWEARFAQLPDPVSAGSTPPSTMSWDKLESRVFGRGASNTRDALPSVSFWKRLSLGLGAACVCMMGAMLWSGQHNDNRAALVTNAASAANAAHATCFVVLTDAAGAPRAVVHDEDAMRTLNVLPVVDSLAPAGAQPMLWIVSNDGALPVGALNTAGKTALRLEKAHMSALMAPGAKISVRFNATYGTTQGAEISGPIALLPAYKT